MSALLDLRWEAKDILAAGASMGMLWTALEKERINNPGYCMGNWIGKNHNKGAGMGTEMRHIETGVADTKAYEKLNFCRCLPRCSTILRQGQDVMSRMPAELWILFVFATLFSHIETKSDDTNGHGNRDFCKCLLRFPPY